MLPASHRGDERRRLVFAEFADRGKPKRAGPLRELVEEHLHRHLIDGIGKLRSLRVVTRQAKIVHRRARSIGIRTTRQLHRALAGEVHDRNR